MNDREKRLAAAVGLAVALWFGNKGLQRYRAAVDANSQQQLAAAGALADAELELLTGQRARRTLNQWRQASLPANRDLARSLYQDWLRSQMADAGLTLKDLADTSNDRAAVGEASEVSFIATAEGSLASLVKFLQRFYAAGHLHRISASNIVKGEGDKLDVSLTIDGLILPGTTRSDKLAEAPSSDALVHSEETISKVAGRNLFTPYSSQTAQVAEAGAQGPDAQAKAAKVTGMMYGAGGWLLSVTKKDAAAPTLFREGDQFEIGRLKGRIVELDGRRVVFETDKGKFVLRGSQSFADAEPLEQDDS